MTHTSRYIAGRLLQGVVVLAGALVISFILVNVSGNPSDVLGGSNVTTQQRHLIAHELGYDRPFLTRFGEYLWHAVQGNLGTSYRTGSSALGEVMGALPHTLVLVATASVLALVLSVPIAVMSVLRRESRTDRTVRRTLMLVGALPEFWVGLVLVLIFSVRLGWLPSTGDEGIESIVLPCLAISLPVVPAFVRVLRGSLLDTFKQDYIVALRGKGFSDLHLVTHQGMLNASIPFLTLVALQIGWLIGGSLIVEVVFAWPGIGFQLIEAVNARDVAVIQASVVIVATAYVILNLMADVAVYAIDPRVRIGRGR